VFDAENGVQIIVVLNDHAGTKLGGRDRHRLKNSPSILGTDDYDCGFAEPAEGGQATSFAATRAKALFYTQVRRKRNLPRAELIEEQRTTPARDWSRGTS
jgi:hypothetical protein